MDLVLALATRLDEPVFIKQEDDIDSDYDKLINGVNFDLEIGTLYAKNRGRGEFWGQTEWHLAVRSLFPTHAETWLTQMNDAMKRNEGMDDFRVTVSTVVLGILTNGRENPFTGLKRAVCLGIQVDRRWTEREINEYVEQALKAPNAERFLTDIDHNIAGNNWIAAYQTEIKDIVENASRRTFDVFTSRIDDLIAELNGASLPGPRVVEMHPALSAQVLSEAWLINEGIDSDNANSAKAVFDELMRRQGGAGPKTRKPVSERRALTRDELQRSLKKVPYDAGHKKGKVKLGGLAKKYPAKKHAKDFASYMLGALSKKAPKIVDMMLEYDADNSQGPFLLDSEPKARALILAAVHYFMKHPPEAPEALEKVKSVVKIMHVNGGYAENKPQWVNTAFAIRIADFAKKVKGSKEEAGSDNEAVSKSDSDEILLSNPLKPVEKRGADELKDGREPKTQRTLQPEVIEVDIPNEEKDDLVVQVVGAATVATRRIERYNQTTDPQKKYEYLHQARTSVEHAKRLAEGVTLDNNDTKIYNRMVAAWSILEQRQKAQFVGHVKALSAVLIRFYTFNPSAADDLPNFLVGFKTKMWPKVEKELSTLDERHVDKLIDQFKTVDQFENYVLGDNQDIIQRIHDIGPKHPVVSAARAFAKMSLTQRMQALMV